MKEWMEHMHQYPELALQETETSKYIGEKVRSFGFDVAEGIGQTGIGASMTLGSGKKSIGLRADFDAFPIQEVNNLNIRARCRVRRREGETMAAVDNWEIELTGKGSHGSMAELGIDPIMCGSSLVMALQTIVSRNVSPWQNSVVSVGAFLSGNAGNVVPQNALLRLSIPNMDPALREMVLKEIRSITKAQAEAFNCQYEIREGVPGAL